MTTNKVNNEAKNEISHDLPTCFLYNWQLSEGKLIWHSADYKLHPHEEQCLLTPELYLQGNNFRSDKVETTLTT